MKATQISYPQPQLLDQTEAVATSNPAPLLETLKLSAGETQPSPALHHLRDGCVVLYRRGRSQVWQVRFKLGDLKWRRFTTKHKELAYAKRAAGEMYGGVRFKEEMGIPQRTRRFSAAADECLKRCESGHRHTGRQIKLLLRDSVELIVATGMRCGAESMNMLWQHIEWSTDQGQRYLRVWVSGKTGGSG